MVGLVLAGIALAYKEMVDPKMSINSGAHQVILRDLPAGCEDVPQYPANLV